MDNTPCCYTISNGKKVFESDKFSIKYKQFPEWYILRSNMWFNKPSAESWTIDSNINNITLSNRTAIDGTYQYWINTYHNSNGTYGLYSECLPDITSYTNTYLSVLYGDKQVNLGMRLQYIQIIPDYINITI